MTSALRMELSVVALLLGSHDLAMVGILSSTLVDRHGLSESHVFLSPLHLQDYSSSCNHQLLVRIQAVYLT